MTFHDVDSLGASFYCHKDQQGIFTKFIKDWTVFKVYNAKRTNSQKLPKYLAVCTPTAPSFARNVLMSPEESLYSHIVPAHGSAEYLRPCFLIQLSGIHRFAGLQRPSSHWNENTSVSLLQSWCTELIAEHSRVGPEGTAWMQHIDVCQPACWSMWLR